MSEQRDQSAVIALYPAVMSPLRISVFVFRRHRHSPADECARRFPETRCGCALLETSTNIAEKMKGWRPERVVTTGRCVMASSAQRLVADNPPVCFGLRPIAGG